MSSYQRAGFTLIESLAAIMLIAMIVPVALSGISHGLRSTSGMHKQQLAMHYAQQYMDYLIHSGDWSVSAASGQFDRDTYGAQAADYSWQLSVESWRDPQVRHLQLIVRWSEREADQVSLDTLVTPEATL